MAPGAASLVMPTVPVVVPEFWLETRCLNGTSCRVMQVGLGKQENISEHSDQNLAQNEAHRDPECFL